jgi:hypothetical protein
MTNNDLIKKKSIALTEATHARLIEVVGFLQAKRGTNTTANQALEILLDGWVELERLACSVEAENSNGQDDLVYVESDFLDKHLR